MPVIVLVAQNVPTIIFKKIYKRFFELVSFFLCSVIKGSERKIRA